MFSTQTGRQRLNCKPQLDQRSSETHHSFTIDKTSKLDQSKMDSSLSCCDPQAARNNCLGGLLDRPKPTTWRRGRGFTASLRSPPPTCGRSCPANLHICMRPATPQCGGGPAAGPRVYGRPASDRAEGGPATPPDHASQPPTQTASQ